MRHVNLYRRGSTLWWRRRLPAGTVRLLHRREIRVSTRTHLSTEAIGRAARLRLLTDALFEVLERAAVDGLSPTPEVMNAIVREVIARELDMAERARALRPALDRAAADALVSGAKARIAQLRDALRRNDLQAAAGPVAAAAKRLGFAIDPNSDDGRILQRLVLRGLIQVAEENHRREQG